MLSKEENNRAVIIRVKQCIKSKREISQREKEQYEKEVASRPVDYKLRLLGLPTDFDVDSGSIKDDIDSIYRSLESNITQDDESSGVCRQEKAALKSCSSSPEKSKRLTLKPKENNLNVIQEQRPSWLQQLSLPFQKQVRILRYLEKDVDRLEKSKQVQETSYNHMLFDLRRSHDKYRMILEEKPKSLNYKMWTQHVQISLDNDSNNRQGKKKKDRNVGSRNRRDDNYYRFDAFGWTKELGYIQVLKSSFAEANSCRIFNILDTYIMSQSFSRDYNILEIGSGSGQHALYICDRINDRFQKSRHEKSSKTSHQTISWYTSDISRKCIDSINKNLNFITQLSEKKEQSMKITDSHHSSSLSSKIAKVNSCIYLDACASATKQRQQQQQQNQQSSVLSDRIDMTVLINVFSYAINASSINTECPSQVLLQSLWKNIVSTYMMKDKNNTEEKRVFIYDIFIPEDLVIVPKKENNITKDEIIKAQIEREKLAYEKKLEAIESLNLRLKGINLDYGVKLKASELIAYAQKEFNFYLESKYEYTDDEVLSTLSSSSSHSRLLQSCYVGLMFVHRDLRNIPKE